MVRDKPQYKRDDILAKEIAMKLFRKYPSTSIIMLAVMLVLVLAGIGANYQMIGPANHYLIVDKLVTIADGDTTPDISGGVRFITSANTGATAITDLDNPTVNQTLTLIGGSNTNSTTITDGGNFNLIEDWIGSLDSTLMLYVQADNDYIELGRSNVVISDPGLSDIAGITPDDGTFIVGDGANWVGETGDTARISMGVGTTDSPTFTSLTLSGLLSNSTITTLTDGDTTPDVNTTNIYKTSNTGATVITAFDNGVTGQEITIIFTDANTTITDGANLNLQGATDFTSTADDTMKLIWDGTSWWELSRSLN